MEQFKIFGLINMQTRIDPTTSHELTLASNNLNQTINQYNILSSAKEVEVNWDT